MSYIEERIKFLAVEAWQRDRKSHELTCDTKDCGEALHYEHGALRCYDCDYHQANVPKAVIDAFLSKI